MRASVEKTTRCENDQANSRYIWAAQKQIYYPLIISSDESRYYERIEDQSRAS